MGPLREGFRLTVRTPYVAGFFLLNLALALAGAAVFRGAAGEVLGHSLAADRLVHGFDLALLTELLFRPELGQAWLAPAPLAVLFALISLALLPGVLQGCIAGRRIPRDAYLAACGRHLGRFFRLAGLFLVAGALLGGLMAWAGSHLVTAAGASTREQLPFAAGLGAGLTTFVVLTALRMGFDLALAHVVVRDTRAVRRSLTAAFRLIRTQGLRLLGVYLVVALLAGLALAGGLALWVWLVPPASVAGAFAMGQGILFLLLFARFWQRAAALSVVFKASRS